MGFEEFCAAELEWWHGYLTFVQMNGDAGRLEHDSGARMFFPNVLLATDCGAFYVYELLGATERYKGLDLKKHEDSSVYRYLSHFHEDEPANGMFNLEPGNHRGFTGLLMARRADFDALETRFPVSASWGSKLLSTDPDGGSLLKFLPGFRSLPIRDCFLVNSVEGIYRCKSIAQMGIFSAEASAQDRTEHHTLVANTGKVVGTITVKGDDLRRSIVGSHLQSLYLSEGLRETTIGHFISKNPEIIHRAFGTDHFVYEAELPWIEHDGTVEDAAINPDLFIRRPDGRYDIADLKTALLDKNVTVGARKRRRFSADVATGAAQLANYREYFSYPANAALAMEKYGISVENPRMILIVGSFENYDVQEVQQASRSMDGMLDVIDYSTLCSLFSTPVTASTVFGR